MFKKSDRIVQDETRLILTQYQKMIWLFILNAFSLSLNIFIFGTMSQIP